MSYLLQLFLVGVVSSFGACLISCWPIALPFVTASSDCWRGRLRSALVFLGAKFLVYGALGFVAGALGRVLTGWLRLHGEALFLVSGSVILLMGIRASLSGAHPCGGVLNRLRRERSLSSPALLGLFVGLLPCTTSTAVMAFIAFTADSPLIGALMGFSFGAGKFFSPLLPATALSSYFTTRFKVNMVWMRWICGALIATMGLRLIFRI